MPAHALDRYAKGEFMESPPVVLGNLLIWLAVYPNGSWNAFEGYVSVYLCFWPIDEALAGDWSLTGLPISIRAMCDEPYVVQEWNGIHARVSKQNYYCGSCELVEHGDIPPGSCLNFLGEVDCEYSLLTSMILRPCGRSMWLQKKFTDLVVGVGDDGQEIPVHRAVLAANSKVFERMLESEMKESSERRVVLRGVSAKAARAFLEFLYTGALPNEDFEASNVASGRISYLSDLMYLAEQYEAPNLTTICASQLARLLCKENVAEIFRLLRQYKMHHSSVNRIFEQQVRNMRAYDELLLNLVDTF